MSRITSGFLYLIAALLAPRNLLALGASGVVAALGATAVQAPQPSVSDMLYAGLAGGSLLAFAFAPGAAVTLGILGLLEARHGRRPAAVVRGIIAAVTMMGPMFLVASAAAVLAGPPSVPLPPLTWLAICVGPFIFGIACNSTPAAASNQ